MRPARDQPGEMRHVDHQQRIDRVRDLSEPGKVDPARIGRSARDDQLGMIFVRQFGDRVIIDPLVLFAHAIGNGVQPLARKGRRGAVGQVPAMRQTEAHQRIARLQQRELHRHVRLCARMRLDIGELGTEQFAGAVDGELLGDIDMLAPAIIAATGIALGIFVGQDRALRLKHGGRDDILRGDEFELIALPAQFRLDRRIDLRIAIGKLSAEKGRLGRVHDAGVGRHRKSSHTFRCRMMTPSPPRRDERGVDLADLRHGCRTSPPSGALR